MKTSLTGIALALVLFVTGCTTATGRRSGLDGTWRLVAPQTLLRATDGSLPPLTPEGRKSYEENTAATARGDFRFDLTTARCSSPGLPRIMLAPGRMRIYVRADIVLIRFEWNRLFRQINLGVRREPQSPESPIAFNRGAEELLFGTMMGRTDGRWEGAQLAARSTGFAEGRLLDNALPASDQLQLDERLRLTGRDTLEDHVTVTDPQNYTAPWDTVLHFKRVADEPFPEDVCLDRKQAGELVWPH